MAAAWTITAQPQEPTESRPVGVQRLQLESGRDGLMVLPEAARERPLPLLVMLHGSGANSSDVLPMVQKPAEEHQCAVLLPDSRDYTWDVLVGGFGPDVQFLNRALERTFAACRVDPEKIALAGFSDGASYALSLGIPNGKRFPHVMAFSPGFMTPPRAEDSPRIFVSHGIGDPVLPIEQCSRRIVPQLEQWGFQVSYQEFHGPHIVPGYIVERAMQWFLKGHHSVEQDATPR